jgi:hypothetical protein
VKRSRFGHGQTPTANGLRTRRGLRIQLTERQRQLCAVCQRTRYEHEREGLVPYHDFAECGRAAYDQATEGTPDWRKPEKTGDL